MVTLLKNLTDVFRQWGENFVAVYHQQNHVTHYIHALMNHVGEFTNGHTIEELDRRV